MYLNIAKIDVIMSFLIVYIFNLMFLIIFFFFIYDSRNDTVTNINFNKNKYKFNVYIYLAMLFGLPPFVSFFVKFFLFANIYNNEKSIYLILFLVVILNITLIYYFFNSIKYFFVYNKPTTKSYRLKNYKYNMFFYLIFFIQIFFYFLVYII